MNGSDRLGACPECGSDDITADRTAGEFVCRNCGAVLDDCRLYDYGWGKIGTGPPPPNGNRGLGGTYPGVYILNGKIGIGAARKALPPSERYNPSSVKKCMKLLYLDRKYGRPDRTKTDDSVPAGGGRTYTAAIFSKKMDIILSFIRNNFAEIPSHLLKSTADFFMTHLYPSASVRFGPITSVVAALILCTSFFSYGTYLLPRYSLAAIMYFYDIEYYRLGTAILYVKRKLVEVYGQRAAGKPLIPRGYLQFSGLKSRKSLLDYIISDPRAGKLIKPLMPILFIDGERLNSRLDGKKNKKIRLVQSSIMFFVKHKKGQNERSIREEEKKEINPSGY